MSFYCSACGRKEPRAIQPFDRWCVPCANRIKLEEPWYVPGMSQSEMPRAQAIFELEHGKKPAITLLDCPFCGAEQAEMGPHLCVADGIAPYIVECMRCRGRSGGSHSFEEAAQWWNTRVVHSPK